MNHIESITRSVQMVRTDLKRTCYIGPCDRTVSYDLWEKLEWELMERILNRVWYQTKYYMLPFTFNPDDPKNHERIS